MPIEWDREGFARLFCFCGGRFGLYVVGLAVVICRSRKPPEQSAVSGEAEGRLSVQQNNKTSRGPSLDFAPRNNL